MDKKKELNARQKKYAILRSAGATEEKAFKGAGYTGSGKQGNTTQVEKKVKEEIKRLQDRQEEKLFDLAKVCQELAPEAITELVGLLRQDRAPQVKVRAIQELLDRGFGKPPQTIETGITVNWDIKRKEQPNE